MSNVIKRKLLIRVMLRTSPKESKCNGVNIDARCPKLLDFKEVLGDHLYGKVFNVCTCESLAQRITGILLECGKDDAFRLLENQDFLMSRIHLAQETLQKCGYGGGDDSVKALPASEILPTVFSDVLYDKVSALEPVFSGQITGMLLEAESVQVEALLTCPQDLKQAVEQARQTLCAAESGEDGSDDEELEGCNLDADSESEESVGDRLFEAVENIYPDPDTASRITGMLLELDTLNLLQLLDDRPGLTDRIQAAYKVLQTT